MDHRDDDVMDLISTLLSAGEEFCIATVVRTANATSAKAGAKAVVRTDGAIEGFLGGGCVQGAVRRTAAEALAEGRPRLIRVKPKDEVVERVDVDGVELHKSSCPSGGTVDIFLEPMRQAPRLVVCGSSPVAAVLCRLAETLGYRVVAAAVEEDRRLFGGKTAFHPGFDFTDLGVGQRDFVVVATQGKRDREALTAAIGSAARYIAFVGSRRKAEKLKGDLRAAGIAEERLATLRAPAGVAIHAIDPDEIALSIMAEIVSVRRQDVREPKESPAAGRRGVG